MLSKFKDGKTFAEERAEKKAAVKKHELSEKAKVRKRDKTCRWPACPCAKLGIRLEVAHLENKAMGGDPQQIRTQAAKMILLCHTVHQGPLSLHSGDRKIEPLTTAGTSGPCRFWEDGVVVGVEKSPHVFEKHGVTKC